MFYLIAWQVTVFSVTCEKRISIFSVTGIISHMFECYRKVVDIITETGVIEIDSPTQAH
jgi:hypothetical protein